MWEISAPGCPIKVFLADESLNDFCQYFELIVDKDLQLALDPEKLFLALDYAKESPAESLPELKLYRPLLDRVLPVGGPCVSWIISELTRIASWARDRHLKIVWEQVLLETAVA